MHIAIFLERPVTNGVTTFIKLLTQTLADQKNTSTSVVYLQLKNENFDDTFKNCRQTAITLADSQNIFQKIWLVARINYHVLKIVFTEKIDCLFFNTTLLTIACTPAILLCKIFKEEIKFVYHFHGSYFLESHKNGKIGSLKTKIGVSFESFVLRQFSTIVTFSKYAQKILKTKLHISETVHIEPGPTIRQKKVPKNKAKKNIGFHPNHKILLYVGRFESRKGINILPEILAQLNFPFKLIFVAPMLEKDPSFDLYTFFKTLQDFDVNEQFIYMTNLSQKKLALYYSAADAFIQPTTELETYGFTTAEALQFSTPVFGFKTGANIELIPLNAHSDFLAKNSTKLAQKINSYFRKPARTQIKIQNKLSKSSKKNWNHYVTNVFF